MQATYDDKGFYCVNTAYIIPIDDKLILAILNSKVTHFYYSRITSSIRGGYMRFIRQYLETIPIPTVFNTSTGQILKIADNVLNLKNQINSSSLTTDRQQLQRAIDHAERRIDELVYELYGLSEEEVAIIEHEH